MLEDAKERLAQLEVANRESEAAATSAPSVPPPIWAKEMEALKARLSSVEEERDAAVRATACKRQATMRSKTSAEIPLMPVHVPKDLDDWMRDRNLDLQEALSLGDGPASVKIDLEVVRGGCTNVHFDWCHADLIWPNAREVSLYGYCGVPVGEASHPGPPKSYCGDIPSTTLPDPASSGALRRVLSSVFMLLKSGTLRVELITRYRMMFQGLCNRGTMTVLLAMLMRFFLDWSRICQTLRV